MTPDDQESPTNLEQVFVEIDALRPEDQDAFFLCAASLFAIPEVGPDVFMLGVLPDDQLRLTQNDHFATPISGILSHNTLQDGALMLMAKLVDGRTLALRLCPGEPIAICIVPKISTDQEGVPHEHE